MEKQQAPGIRELTQEEMAAVGGGWYDFGFVEGAMSGGGGYDGGDQYAGLGKLLDIGSRVWSGIELLNWGVDQTKPGVAGTGANENDNGGTSYGIGICNTYGCR